MDHEYVELEAEISGVGENDNAGFTLDPNVETENMVTVDNMDTPVVYHTEDTGYEADLSNGEDHGMEITAQIENMDAPLQDEGETDNVDIQDDEDDVGDSHGFVQNNDYEYPSALHEINNEHNMDSPDERQSVTVIHVSDVEQVPDLDEGSDQAPELPPPLDYHIEEANFDAPNYPPPLEDEEAHANVMNLEEYVQTPENNDRPPTPDDIIVIEEYPREHDAQGMTADVEHVYHEPVEQYELEVIQHHDHPDSRRTGIYDDPVIVHDNGVDDTIPIVENEVTVIDHPKNPDHASVQDLTKVGIEQSENNNMHMDSVPGYGFSEPEPMSDEYTEVARHHQHTGNGRMDYKLDDDPERQFWFKAKAPVNMNAYFCISACVFFCCNILFGLIALCFVRKGRNSKTGAEARKWGCIAIGISILGILVTAAIILAVGFTSNWTI